ncbi:MAG: hypothetical protein GEU75_02640 [Dehalococcoidia bacterium]|nr:hypothetical protein [Dehalococcoidia bacterium]
MIKQRTLTLREALRVINAVVDYAEAHGHVGIACVVLDKDAQIIAGVKMDGRVSRFYKAAHRKAYAAAVFERDTSAVVDLHKSMEANGTRGPYDWNDPMLTTLPGGYVVVDDEENVLGSISVAGGGGGISDWEFADIGFAALGEGFHHRPGSIHG